MYKRQDLFHRLDEFTVQIPPLRERKEDIPAFAESFLQDANRELEKQVEGFDAATAAWMNRYKWPGNLRQMRNAKMCIRDSGKCQNDKPTRRPKLLSWSILKLSVVHLLVA